MYDNAHRIAKNSDGKIFMGINSIPFPPTRWLPDLPRVPPRERLTDKMIEDGIAGSEGDMPLPKPLISLTKKEKSATNLRLAGRYYNPAPTAACTPTPPPVPPSSRLCPSSIDNIHYDWLCEMFSWVRAGDRTCPHPRKRASWWISDILKIPFFRGILNRNYYWTWFALGVWREI